MRSMVSLGDTCRTRTFLEGVLPPALLHLVEIAVAVVPLQGRLIVVRPQSLAEELGELRRAARLRQELHHGDTFGIEGADVSRVGIVVEAHELANGEELTVAAILGQVAEMAFDLLAWLGENGHAFVGPARHRLIAEPA